VLYAPTWEDAADYNNYSSIDTIGPEIVRRVLDVRDVRLVYKPHPRVTLSTHAGIRSGHRRILKLVSRAAAGEPRAGHVSLLESDILAVMPSCDAMITDVSSVGLDWLYLRTERPLLITDRHDDPVRLRLTAPVSRCAVVVHSRNVDELTDLLTAQLEHDELHLARIAMRRYYFDDAEVGSSTARFVSEVRELVALRDRLLPGYEQVATREVRSPER
jgi:CDP-glycerol glycerophosphotransferase (TagB/SpsB family)